MDEKIIYDDQEVILVTDSNGNLVYVTATNWQEIVKCL